MIKQRQQQLQWWPGRDTNNKDFVIKINDKLTTVSIDRIKPAFQLTDPQLHTPTIEIKSDKIKSIPVQYKCTEKIITTKSGRKVHFPKHLSVYC